jgi:hypothetical protein
MSFYRKDAVNKIRSLSGTVLNHILKAKYVKDERNKNHWISEIKAYFDKIDGIEIKPFNRKFSETEYLEFLLVEPYCDSTSSAKKGIFAYRKDYVDKIIRKINKEYGSDIENVDFESITEFFKKISKTLERNEDLETIILKEFE